MGELISRQEVENKILIIRNREVMIDSDVAEMYGVLTGEINRRIKNNPQKFPNDLYYFELDGDEKQYLIQNYERLERLKFSPHNPKAFTEYGIIMMSTILNTEVAIRLCHLVVETFIEVKKQQKTIQELKSEVEHLKSKLNEEMSQLDTRLQDQLKEYDLHFQVVFQELQKLRKSQLEGEEKKIGFLPKSMNKKPDNK